MRVTKIGVNLVERCARYAKACGNSSILYTKPQSKFPKSKDLGYIHKDGTINFNSIDAAYNYAKTKCVKALNCSKPHEHLVEIKGSRVVYENSGTYEHCYMSNKNIADTCFHGHPDTYAKGCACAPSLDDFWGLANSTRQREDIVFNSAGEYYSMKKVRDVSYNKRTIIGILTDIDIAFYKHIFKEYPKRIQKKLDTAIKFEDDNAFYQLRHDYATFPGWNIPKNMVDRTHTFWLKHANELGLKVETNFSNFKDLKA